MKASPNSSVKKVPQSRGMSASLRRLAARRVARALSTGALLAFGAHSALSQAIPTDIQYTFQTSGGTFSTGFTPPFTGDINGQLNFGAGITSAIDDLASASVNDLTFNNTAALALTASAATNVLTLTTNSAGVLPSIYVGSGPVTINTSLAGTSGFVKTGTGALTLAANADTFTGTATVNQGTLNVNVGQNINAAFAINNGATLTTNQALPASIFITALSGTSTFNSTSATFAGTLVGNGNLLSSQASASAVNQSLLFGFGGTITFTNATNLRIIGSSTGGTFNAAFANVDFGSLAGNFNTRDGAQIILGGLNSTSTTATIGNANSGGTVGEIIGSANGNTTYNGVIVGGTTTSLTKVGTGTLTLAGLNTYTGATNVNGGTLLLNFGTNATNVLSNGAVAPGNLTFGGGTLSLVGKNSAATTQTLGTLTVGQGGGSIVLAAGTGTVTTGSNPPVTVPASTTLTLGALTATAAGGSLNVSAGANTSVTTTTAPGATGTYGGRITFTDSTGATNWATSASSATPFTLSGYNGYSVFNTGGGTDTLNSLVTDGALLSGALTTNSLKATDTAAGNTLDLGGNTLTLTNGGLLFTGLNAYTITDGTLTSGTSATAPDLIISQFGAGNLTIGATISNGAATGAGTLTKAGTGTLTLTGANTYTGSTFLNNGVTSIGAATALGAPTATATLTLNGGTLQATNSLTLAGGGAANYVLIGGGGGTFDVTGGSNLSITAAIANLAGNQFGPLTKTGAGTLTLTGANTYGGATIIRGGVLSTNLLANGSTNVGTVFTTNSSGIGAAQNVANALILDGGTLQYTGAAVSTDRTFTLTNNGGALDSSGSGAVNFSNTIPGAYTGSGARTLTLTGSAGTGAAPNILATPLMDGTGGSTSVAKTGAGAWQLSGNETYTGSTTVSAGTLNLVNGTTTNSVASSPTITVTGGATLGTAGLQGGGITLANGQTLQGGGTVTGGITANTGATLSPGDNGVGTLTVGSLSLGTGSILNFGFSAGANALINDLGALNLTGTGIGLNLLQAGTANKFTTDGTYTLFNFGTETGSPTADFSILNPATGLSYAFNLNGTALQLTITGQSAVTSTWNNTGGGSWGVAGNWDNNTVPNAAGGTAIFGTKITAPSTVTLDGSKTVGEVDFNNTNSYTIATGSPATSTLLLNNSGTSAILKDLNGSHTISAPISMALGTSAAISAGATLTLSGPVSNTGAAGTGVLTKSGAGTLALLGANTYADGTTITGGTVQINSASSLGAATGVATLNSSGAAVTLEALNSITSARNFSLTGATNNFQVDGAGIFELDGLLADGAGGAGSLTKTGVGTLALTNINSYTGGTTISAGTLSLGAGGATGSVLGTITDNANLTTNGTDNPTINNTIAGTGSLTQAGADNVTLGGTNTFTGSTVISAGTLTLGNALALQNSTLNYNNQGGTLGFGTLTAATLGGLAGGQSLALTNALTALNGVALSVGGNNQSTTYSGGLSGTGSSLTKNGIGTLTLTGANGYTGNTNLFGGGLTLATGGSIGSAATPSGAFVEGNAAGQALINGGSLVAGAASTIATGSGGFFLTSGSATFNAGLTTTSAGGDGLVIEVDGGAFSTTSLSLSRNQNYATLPITSAAIANSGFYSTGGTSSLGVFTIANAATNSSGSAKINGGAVTATDVNIGLNATGRFNVLNVNAGSFTTTDTSAGAIGIGLSPFAAATTFGGTNAELLLTGGTTTTPVVTFGTATTASGTGTLTLAAPAGSNAFLYLGNTAAPGSAGLVEPSTAGFASTITLTNGTVGAAADWTAAVPMTLGTTTFQAADANGVAHNITLSGPLSGAGASLTKTGGGTLTLTAANSYTGATNINAGTLAVNGSTDPGSAVTVATGATLTGTGTVNGAVTDNGIINPGAVGAVGAVGTLTIGAGGLTLSSASVLNFDLSGTTTDLLTDTGAFAFTGSGAAAVNFSIGSPLTAASYTFANLGTGTVLSSEFSFTNPMGYTASVNTANNTLVLTQNPAAPTVTSTTYTLATTAGASRIITGTSTGVTSTITNTGTGTADTLSFTGLGATPTTGTTTSGGPLAQGASSSNTGLTFTGGALGNQTITAAVGTATNATLGTAATLSGAAGTATVDVVGNRTVSATAVNFGRFILGGAVGSQASALSSATGDHLTDANLTVKSGAAGTDTSNGATITATSGSSQTFDGTNGAGTLTVSKSGTFSNAGLLSGTVTLAGNTTNFTGELAGQTLNPVSVAYTANPVNNRTLTATGVTFGNVRVGTTPASQTSSLSSTGTNAATANLTVNAGATGTDGKVTVTGGGAVTFDGTNNTNGDSLTAAANFTTAGAQSGTVTISASNFTGELAGQTVSPVTIAYTGNAYSGKATYVGASGSYGTSNATVQSQWSDGGTPGVDAGVTGVDTASFGTGGGVASANNNATVSLNGANPNLNAITFATTGTGAVTLAQGSGGTVTLAGTAPKITNTSGANAITAPVAFSTPGTITVSGGSLGLGQVSGAGSTTVSLAGGTTLVSDLSPAGTAPPTKPSDTFGALTVTGGVATLDFGAGNTGEIFTFTGTNADTFGSLNIINYVGNPFTPPTGVAAGGGFDQLFFAPGTAHQLLNVAFISPSGMTGNFTGRLLNTGEVVAPEPSQFVSLGLGLLGIGLLGARTWRKSRVEAAEAA